MKSKNSETNEYSNITSESLIIQPKWKTRVIYEVRPNLCTCCRICELVCSLHLSGEFNPTKSAIRLVRKQSAGVWFPIVSPFGGILFDDKREPVLCDLCNGKPKCVRSCPTNALIIIQKEEGK